MNKGILYGVSVGPGDPELLTLAAARILAEADVIASPNIGSGLQTALRIVKDHIGDTPVIDCSTPMTSNKEESAQAYDEIADKLSVILDEGKTVAFLALGDAGIYSTYFYIHTRMVKRGYTCELVPGVPSFCASAAKLGIPLCEGAEQFTVIPVSTGEVETSLDLPGTKVYMKSGKSLKALREVFTEHGVVDKASMVANCGLEHEEVYPEFATADVSKNTMAIVILKSN